MGNDSANPLINEILTSRKYRSLGIPPVTVRDLLDAELALGSDKKTAVKMVKKKMHNLVALYLGNPDYAASAQLLDSSFREGDKSIQLACTSILAEHASTRERQEILEGFYHRLWAVTGLPNVILDLACGLHPLAFPWMNLPSSVLYYAYDIHAPRIDLINHFFTLEGMQPLGKVQDILVEPPSEKADVAIFFKEAHRFEQRRRGCNRHFWQVIQAKWLLVSLPTSSLSGKHDLLDQHRKLVTSTIKNLPWDVVEVEFPGEIVFCIHKTNP